MTLVSADWRFLEPMPRHGRALVYGSAIPQLEEAFEVTTIAAGPTPPDSTFDLAVVTGHAGVEELRLAARATVGSGGVVVAGEGDPTAHRALARPVIARARALRRRIEQAGLEVVATYGSVPNPWNPEYLYPLGGTTARIAILRFLESRRPSSRVEVAVRGLPASLVSAIFTTGVLVIAAHPAVHRQ